MDNVKKLPQETIFQADLIKNLKAIGYTDQEVQEALNFISENPLNNDGDNNPPPPKKQKPELDTQAEIIPFPSKKVYSFRKAA